jgi:hypothetical protein
MINEPIVLAAARKLGVHRLIWRDHYRKVQN